MSSKKPKLWQYSHSLYFCREEIRINLESPLVAIVIINWNAFEITRDCLKSLRQTTWQNKILILVDNHSSDDSAARLSSDFPEIKLIQAHANLGFTGGNNLGIREALIHKPDYIMLLNNDTIVTPGFLEPLINIFKNFKDTGAVQPKILFNHDRTLIWSAGGRYFPWIAQSPTIGYLKKDQDRYNKPNQTDWTSNCCALYSTEALLKAGLLNEIYFYGSFDDVDVSLKISALGKKLFYCPESVIYHIAGMAARSETPEAEGQMKPFVRYLVSRNNWFFIRTHTPWFFLPLVFIYTSMHATALLCFSLIKGRKSKAKAILGGYIDGLRLPLEPEKINHSEAIQYYSR